MAVVNESMAFSSDLKSVRMEMLMVVISLIMSLMNTFSSALLLVIEGFLIRIVIVRGA